MPVKKPGHEQFVQSSDFSGSGPDECGTRNQVLVAAQRFSVRTRDGRPRQAPREPGRGRAALRPVQRFNRLRLQRLRARIHLAGLSVTAATLILHSVSGQTPRLEVLQAMLQRPNDPWPRGKGHVVLAVPGCLEVSKGYHEPGGSFSPSFGSMGVSIWVTDNDGKIQTTSDTLSLEQIQQRLVWQRNRALPAILTDTPHYRAVWSFVGN